MWTKCHKCGGYYPSEIRFGDKTNWKDCRNHIQSSFLRKEKVIEIKEQLVKEYFPNREVMVLTKEEAEHIRKRRIENPPWRIWSINTVPSGNKKRGLHNEK